MPEDPPSRLHTQDDKKEQHRAGEQFQPEHASDQGAEEVGLETKDPRKEGRTDTAVHEPAPQDREDTPSTGQSIKGSGRSAPGR